MCSKEAKLKDAPPQNKKELMEYTFDGQVGISFRRSMQAMQEDKVEKTLKDILNFISPPAFSENSNYGQDSLLEV